MQTCDQLRNRIRRTVVLDPTYYRRNFLQKVKHIIFTGQFWMNARMVKSLPVCKLTKYLILWNRKRWHWCIERKNRLSCFSAHKCVSETLGSSICDLMVNRANLFWAGTFRNLLCCLFSTWYMKNSQWSVNYILVYLL